jgi:ppGpp synthetase/RelA/SpoT-type nucleotidyltranferase
MKCESVDEKPETFPDYIKWLKDGLSVNIGDRDRTRYDHVTSKMRQDFEKSEFWTQLINNLAIYDHEYQVGKGYNLFLSPNKPELDIKSYDSFLLKTYRKNVLENESWPKEPEGGWMLPNNWFSRINDIIRTLLTVKYFDGVDYVINKIESLCKEHEMEFQVFYEAREEGYYAAHSYTKQCFEIPAVTWDTQKINVSIEIQVSTQLQEVIRTLLHKYYDTKRKMVKKPIEKWQWDYKCDEFCVNYLGHILHYVEGMILEVRDRQKEKSM